MVRILILFLFFSNYAFAENACEIFWDQLDRNTNELLLSEPPIYKFYSYGFDLKRTTSSEALWSESEDSEYEIYAKLYNNIDINEVYMDEFGKSEKILKHLHPIVLYDASYETIQIGGSRLCNEKKRCEKLGEKFLKQNNYLIIEQDYGDFIYDLDDITQHPLHKSKFLNSSTFSGSMWNGYDDGYYISTGQSFISHIDDIPVSKISDSDLIKIFYFAKYKDRKKFRLHTIHTKNFNDELIYHNYVDVYLEALPTHTVPIKFDFKFGEFFDIKTVNNEISFNYNQKITWRYNDIDSIGKKISDKYWKGNGFYCSMNLEEYNNGNYILWKPNFKIDDTKSSSLELDDINFQITYWPEDGTYGEVSLSASDILHKQLNLYNFPFDRQDISVLLTAHDLESNKTSLFYNNDMTYRLNEWDLPDGEWAIHSTDIMPQDNAEGLNNWISPAVEINLIVDRKSSYYVFKIILPILILLSLLFCSILIPPIQLESKLTLTVVCFLALIAYIFVIDDNVPKLSYMTLMDFFILISFIFAAIPNFLAIYDFRYFKKNNYRSSLSQKMIWLIPSTYAICVILFFYFNIQTHYINTSSAMSFLKF